MLFGIGIGAGVTSLPPAVGQSLAGIVLLVTIYEDDFLPFFKK
jgi:hypothetical protein